MCKSIGKSYERILCKLSRSEILRLYSIVHVAMETTQTSHFTCQSKSFNSIFFTCKVSACELQPFFCHDLANDIYSQTAKTVFSHLKSFPRWRICCPRDTYLFDVSLRGRLWVSMCSTGWDLSGNWFVSSTENRTCSVDSDDAVCPSLQYTWPANNGPTSKRPNPLLACSTPCGCMLYARCLGCLYPDCRLNKGPSCRCSTLTSARHSSSSCFGYLDDRLTRLSSCCIPGLLSWTWTLSVSSLCYLKDTRLVWRGGNGTTVLGSNNPWLGDVLVCCPWWAIAWSNGSCISW